MEMFRYKFLRRFRNRYATVKFFIVIINLSMVVWLFILQVVAREPIAQPIDPQMA